jgi:hypothetical protein
MSRSSRDDNRQPRDVSETVTNYLDMTAPRERRPPLPERPRRRSDAQRPTERDKLIDNEGLSLEEGNDFA